MKKLFFIAFVAALLTACGGKGSEASQAETGADSVGAAQVKVVQSLYHADLENPDMLSKYMTRKMIDEICIDEGMVATWAILGDPGDDPEATIKFKNAESVGNNQVVATLTVVGSDRTNTMNLFLVEEDGAWKIDSIAQEGAEELVEIPDLVI